MQCWKPTDASVSILPRINWQVPRLCLSLIGSYLGLGFSLECLVHITSVISSCSKSFITYCWSSTSIGRMLVWLCVWVKVQICIWPSWCHCHSLSLTPVNPDWFYLPGFTFLVPAQPGSPGQNPRGLWNEMVVCVCVCVCGCHFRKCRNNNSIN